MQISGHRLSLDTLVAILSEVFWLPHGSECTSIYLDRLTWTHFFEWPYISLQLPNVCFCTLTPVSLTSIKLFPRQITGYILIAARPFISSPTLSDKVLVCSQYIVFFPYHAVWCSKLIFNSAHLPRTSIWRHCKNFDIFIKTVWISKLTPYCCWISSYPVHLEKYDSQNVVDLYKENWYNGWSSKALNVVR
jgi:hypothetical protein